MPPVDCFQQRVWLMVCNAFCVFNSLSPSATTTVSFVSNKASIIKQKVQPLCPAHPMHSLEQTQIPLLEQKPHTCPDQMSRLMFWLGVSNNGLSLEEISLVCDDVCQRHVEPTPTVRVIADENIGKSPHFDCFGKLFFLWIVSQI